MKENEQNVQHEEGKKQRYKQMEFSKEDFAKLIITELSSSKDGRQLLKKYKQSEVREIVENYHVERNQVKLREISNILYAKSSQYRSLIGYYSGLSLFAQVVAPSKDIKKMNSSKVMKQYTQLGELLKLMNLRHEMKKVLSVAFREDTFYGYVHKDVKSFYIQPIDANICRISTVEDGIYGFSIDMSYFSKRESVLADSWAEEVRVKYYAWKAMRAKNAKLSPWVELDGRNTICIKISEDMLETFPPFAGSFDSIFDIEAFKQLRKDKEELENYMMISMELPMRKDSEDNNDFMIDLDMMRYFHNLAAESVPENVGVITSPMPLNPIKFDKNRMDNDGVAKATRDLWESFTTSQQLFSADKTTSEGLKASIKTDEEVVFGVTDQVERWLNRYLKYNFGDLAFNVKILHVTHFNRESMYKMYAEVGALGVPVKSHLCATVGLEPIEMMNMAYLENDLLKMHEEFIPLQSSHTQSNEELQKQEGAPQSDNPKDETVRDRDKPNGSGS